MIEPTAVTLFPVCFLIVLFGGGELLRRRNIDMGGNAPIDKRVFSVSKYLILVPWGSMVVHAWRAYPLAEDSLGVLRWVALFLWFSGFTLLFVGRFGLGESFRIGSPKESTGLKVNGLFRFSRNPMYVGVYATLCASTLYTRSLVTLVIAVFIVAVHHRIVLAEEGHLMEAFGEEYAHYRSRVRRYV